MKRRRYQQTWVVSSSVYDDAIRRFETSARSFREWLQAFQDCPEDTKHPPKFAEEETSIPSIFFRTPRTLDALEYAWTENARSFPVGTEEHERASSNAEFLNRIKQVRRLPISSNHAGQLTSQCGETIVAPHYVFNGASDACVSSFYARMYAALQKSMLYKVTLVASSEDGFHVNRIHSQEDAYAHACQHLHVCAEKHDHIASAAVAACVSIDASVRTNMARLALKLLDGVPASIETFGGIARECVRNTCQTIVDSESASCRPPLLRIPHFNQKTTITRLFYECASNLVEGQYQLALGYLAFVPTFDNSACVWLTICDRDAATRIYIDWQICSRPVPVRALLFAVAKYLYQKQQEKGGVKHDRRLLAEEYTLTCSRAHHLLRPQDDIQLYSGCDLTLRLHPYTN